MKSKNIIKKHFFRVGVYPPKFQWWVFLWFNLLLMSFTFAVNIKTPFVNVFVKGVVPGKEFSLVKNGYPSLKIYNKNTEKIVVKVSVDINQPVAVGGIQSEMSLRAEGEAISDRLPRPDGHRDSQRHFVSIEKPYLEIPGNSFAETDILLNVYNEKKNWGKKFEFTILTQTIKKDEMFSVGLKSKLIFETIEKYNRYNRDGSGYNDVSLIIP